MLQAASSTSSAAFNSSFEERVEQMQHYWHKVPTYMMLFSSTMLKLHTELNVSTVSKEEDMIEYKRLRDDVKRDGQLYCKAILPETEKVVLNLSDYLDNFAVLDYEEWKDDIASIHRDVVKYKITCDNLIKQHKKLMGRLRGMLSRTNDAFQEMKKVKSKYKQQMEELHENAGRLKNEADRNALIGK